MQKRKTDPDFKEMGLDFDGIGCPCPSCVWRSTPLYRKIKREYDARHPPPAKGCEEEAYCKYVSGLAYFANYIYIDNGRTLAEKNLKYSLCDFDYEGRLPLEYADIEGLKEKAHRPSMAGMRQIAKWAEKYPEDESMLDIYAEALFNNLQFLEAKNVLDRIEKLYPEKKSHDLINTRIQMAVRQDFDIDTALKLADEGLLLYPNSFDLNISKAFALSWGKDKTGAKTYLDAARKIDPERHAIFMKDYWVESPPEFLMMGRFMHTLNEMMMLINGRQMDEARPLLERAKRFCPETEGAKMLLLNMEFDFLMKENRIERAGELVAEMLGMERNESSLYCDAMLAYRKKDMNSAIEKALESQRICSKKRVRYFIPALSLLEEIYRVKGDEGRRREIQTHLKEARAYLSTFRHSGKGMPY